ncbi:membrane protein [Arthrobacter phage Nellie]|uniref:Membrane protein n=3 Tax=Jasminevirus TaxID=2560153 RepID=A0A0U4K027_9CAUD|nr:hypothetical protein FDG92_gp20 [Arthrobacter phage Jasmine]YP_009613242.1 hypothetical protein FDI47_gp18 [Arthrobacter phage Adat]ALY09292.1 membrane protein [Arthrobacter phage Jasmine]ASZ72591.1 membrane protein [Arthrobacter phage Adat]ASZ73737.1 membrane protein [Arthrobacter phage Nellie]
MVSTESDNYTQIRVDIGELKGILTTVITEHGRRITDIEQNAVRLRTDLTAVKDEITKEVTSVSTRVTTNSGDISNIREDVKNLFDRAGQSFPRTTAVIALIVAAGGFLWNVFGGK